MAYPVAARHAFSFPDFSDLPASLDQARAAQAALEIVRECRREGLMARLRVAKTGSGASDLGPEVLWTLEELLEGLARRLPVAVLEEGEPLTTQHVAELLGVSRPTAIRLLSERKDILPSYRVGASAPIRSDRDVSDAQGGDPDLPFDGVQESPALSPAPSSKASDEDPVPAPGSIKDKLRGFSLDGRSAKAAPAPAVPLREGGGAGASPTRRRAGPHEGYRRVKVSDLLDYLDARDEPTRAFLEEGVEPEPIRTPVWPDDRYEDELSKVALERVGKELRLGQAEIFVEAPFKATPRAKRTLSKRGKSLGTAPLPNPVGRLLGAVLEIVSAGNDPRAVVLGILRTERAAAALLGVSPRTMGRILADGEVPAVRTDSGAGRAGLRFDTRCLDRFLSGSGAEDARAHRKDPSVAHLFGLLPGEIGPFPAGLGDSGSQASESPAVPAAPVFGALAKRKGLKATHRPSAEQEPGLTDAKTTISKRDGIPRRFAAKAKARR